VQLGLKLLKLKEGVGVGRIWDGGDVAQELLKRVREEVALIQREGRPPPVLATISVGESPVREYIQALHADACRLTGISSQAYVFPQRCHDRTILQTLAELNASPTVTGIALHGRPSTYLSELGAAITPEKDVDGLHPLHLGRFITNKSVRRPPCGADIVQLLERAGLTLTGAHVACIGDASGLGGLLALLCLHENATVSAWRETTAWPSEVLQRADVLILDTEDLPVVAGTALKPGVAVVDARHHPDGWLPRQPEGLPEAVSLLIPVPGGVGPTSVARRMASLVAMYRLPVPVHLDS
jgi:methylenetetrahydrofolate dehydrogenase (NADP+)/methenyltetrahydrofolate cyclohydrolase